MSAVSLSSANASPGIAPQTFDIRPFNGAVGAEIIGLDLSRPINDRDFARVQRAHLDHHVVVFRDQRITCLLYTSPSPRDRQKSRMPSSA